MDQEAQKQLLGIVAVDRYIRSDSKVGLGTGSTAKFAVIHLGEKLASGELKNVVAVPTSEATAKLAQECKIPLISLDDLAPGEKLAVTIDGADEVLCVYEGDNLKRIDLVKGRGAALLREKMIEKASEAFVCITDASKLNQSKERGWLGLCKTQPKGVSDAMPVEVTAFSSLYVLMDIETQFAANDMACKAVFRTVGDEEKLVTDNGNYIIDLHFFKALPVAARAQMLLEQITGVVETGFFLGLCNAVLFCSADGEVSTLELKK